LVLKTWPGSAGVVKVASSPFRAGALGERAHPVCRGHQARLARDRGRLEDRKIQGLLQRRVLAGRGR
jgi:hypothetical protein